MSTTSINSTFRVLKSSLFLSFSGLFYLYVAFVVLGHSPSLLLCAGFSLVIYSVYTFDRAMGGEEDVINREGTRGADKRIPMVVVLICFLASSALLGIEGLIPLGSLLPFLIGFMYSKGISFGGKSIRFKSGMGGKNVIVGLTWGLSGVAFVYRWGTWPQLTVIATFFSIKLFINTIIYDCRDIKGDRAANLKTIPVALGLERTKKYLHALNLALHVAIYLLFLSGVIRFPPKLLFFSGAMGAGYIQFLTVEKDTVFRDVFVDGEWIFIALFTVLLRWVSIFP